MSVEGRLVVHPVVHVDAQSGEARRALVLHDRPLVVDLIELTLNHGLFVVRAAQSLAEADAILAEWRPHLAVIDMDHDDSSALLGRLGASNSLTRSITPVLGLTRRGDLKTKLKAFDLGVDDILTMPFLPEELLARSIVITRRAFGADQPIVPTIRLGEMEIDIVSREVRTGHSMVHLIGIDPLQLALFGAAFTALVLPISLAPFLVVMNDADYLGNKRNGILTNVATIAILAIAFVVAAVSMPLLILSGG